MLNRSRLHNTPLLRLIGPPDKIIGLFKKPHILFRAEICIVRKNHLARYNKQKVDDEFEKVVVIYDEPFLREFQERQTIPHKRFFSPEAFLRIKNDKSIPEYLGSSPAPKDQRAVDEIREKLLVLILYLNPKYGDILFDFGKPDKIDLRSFMHQNYKFNVSIERLAFLTGRSLSAFKRDFAEMFNDTPSRWLMKRRLKEAHFLIGKKSQKPSDIYIDLGFEDLSHFSFTFKKMFSVTPTALREQIHTKNHIFHRLMLSRAYPRISPCHFVNSTNGRP